MGGMIAYATAVHFTACLLETPQICGENKTKIILGGVRAGTAHARFYQPAVALGRLAGRVARLSKGAAVTGTGTLLQEDGRLLVLPQDISHIEPDASRLETDTRGGVLLRGAVMDIRTRGMLLHDPRVQKLEDGSRVANVSLGLTPYKEEQTENRVPLIPIELAFYEELAGQVEGLERRRYVAVSGQLQRRRLGDGFVDRIKVKHLEKLHPTRAML